MGRGQDEQLINHHHVLRPRAVVREDQGERYRSDGRHESILIKLKEWADSEAGDDIELRDDLMFTGERVADTIKQLHASWIPSQPTAHNYFLDSIASELKQGSQDSRRLTSRLGYALQSLSNDFAKRRYGDKAARVLYSKLTPSPSPSDCEVDSGESSNDVLIWTTANQRAVKNEAGELLS